MAAIFSNIDHQSGEAYVHQSPPWQAIDLRHASMTRVLVYACNWLLHFNPLMAAVVNLHLIFLSVRLCPCEHPSQIFVTK